MWQLADKTLDSRLLLGTAQYPSLQTMHDAVVAAQTNVITVSLRRQISNPQDLTKQQTKEGHSFWDYIKALNCHLLPNTAGCRCADDAVTTAEMARELFRTHWIKLEVIADSYTLQPDPFELLKAAKILVQKGFEVFPYCTEDLIVCQRLQEVGCRVLMPWASPIGSAQGLINRGALQTLRARLPDATIIIDAGIGKPSQAAQALEMGFDGVLLNTAVALATNPVHMARAFMQATAAGRLAYEAGLVTERGFAAASTALIDTPFWHQETQPSGSKR